MKKLTGIVGNIFTAAIIVIVITSLYSMLQYHKNPDKVPSVFGFSTMSVLTGSMRPYLEPGDMIVDRSLKAEDIKVGDVITYKNRGSIVTHRVKEIIRKDGNILFLTRGDANNTDDGSPISEDQIIGKVILKIPYGGYAARFVRSPVGLLLIIVIPITYMLFGELKNLLSGGKSKKVEKNKPEDSINIQ